MIVFEKLLSFFYKRREKDDRAKLDCVVKQDKQIIANLLNLPLLVEAEIVQGW